MNRIVAVLLLMFGCSCTNSTESRAESQFVQDTVERWEQVMREAQARHERAVMREKLRAHGYRVCEEGEVGTKWMEDCNSCICHPGGVRGCTMMHCKEPGENQPPAERILPRPKTDRQAQSHD